MNITKTLHKKILLSLAILLTLPYPTTQAQEPTTGTAGWSFPYLGAGRGTWDASVGVFVWSDTFHARNLQLRGDMDLGAGLRWHTVVRSNREQDTLSGFDPS